jgi:hypothetical protein
VKRGRLLHVFSSLLKQSVDGGTYQPNSTPPSDERATTGTGAILFPAIRASKSKKKKKKTKYESCCSWRQVVPSICVMDSFGFLWKMLYFLGSSGRTSCERSVGRLASDCSFVRQCSLSSLIRIAATALVFFHAINTLCVVFESRNVKVLCSLLWCVRRFAHGFWSLSLI